jgi:hypothetical protein
MKKCVLLFICLGFTAIIRAQPVLYEDYFTGERLRLDLVFAGNASSQDVFLLALHKEPVWAGSTKQLIAPFTFGEYQYKVYTKQEDLIYSKGFNSLFMEWRTTWEATLRIWPTIPLCGYPTPKTQFIVKYTQGPRGTGRINP